VGGVYERYGVRPLINAAGPYTRLGNALLEPAVRAAIEEAAEACVSIAELQRAAGRVIARVTGAESGYVVSGAAAGLTMAAAACIAGRDPERIDALPQADGLPNEIVLQRGHRGYYDHALRAAGARLVAVEPEAEAVRAAIGSRTAAVFYDAAESVDVLSLEAIVEAAGAVPVIVDAAMAIPPAANLRRLGAAGAALVALSGGKAIGGPAGTGALAGREALIESVALQHQDEDVLWMLHPEPRPDPPLDPPVMGIGRGFKVGREEIVGFLCALERYASRDHAAYQARWRAELATIEVGLDGRAGVTTARHDPDDASQPPWLDVDVDGASAAELRAFLGAQPTPIVAAYVPADVLRLYPHLLRPGDAHAITSAIVRAHRSAS
jgi:D-glucosaminate-6-phosphate ammonia-lyase